MQSRLERPTRSRRRKAPSHWLLPIACGVLLAGGLGGCIVQGPSASDAAPLVSGVRDAQAPLAGSGLGSGVGSGTSTKSTDRGTGALKVEPVLWKERLEQPYVFVEVFGDYRRIGDTMRALQQRAKLAGIEASGPPFVLYFDDPAQVATSQLRARACLPVNVRIGSSPGLELDLLPRAMVAYTNVRGAYPELPRAYPSLFNYLRDHGWVANGPLREIYFTDPGGVESWDDLQSELQLPWRPSGS